MDMKEEATDFLTERLSVEVAVYFGFCRAEDKSILTLGDIRMTDDDKTILRDSILGEMLVWGMEENTVHRISLYFHVYSIENAKNSCGNDVLNMTESNPKNKKNVF